MKNIALLLFVLLTATTAHAADEMRKLDFLLGEWEGEAWMQIGRGPREQIVQTERVRSKLGGQVLLIEGLGKRRLEDGSAGEIVHDAMAVVSWDPERKSYRFATWVAGRPDGDLTLDLVAPNTAVWTMDVPSGRMRYTIRLTDEGAWNEIGEFTRDGGTTWSKFFEMNLEKK